MGTMYFPEPALLVDLESVLRRRGHLPIKRGDIAQTLFPEDRMMDVLSALGQFEFVRHLGPEPLAHYMNHFAKASFRKMARRLLRNEREWTAVADLESIAGSSTLSYLLLLERLQMLERRDGEVQVTRAVDNLGPSLEHYVAQLCIRELRGAAEWGVTLEELPRAGGDYDVLAWLDPSLVYIECKSGRPGSIEESEVREFFQRTVELSPDLAIFLVDTSDELTPLIDGVMNPILRGALGITEPGRRVIQSLPDYPRVSSGFQRIYVTNSSKTILTQVRRCLQHYYAHVKGVARYGIGPHVNFTAASVRDDA